MSDRATVSKGTIRKIHTDMTRSYAPLVLCRRLKWAWHVEEMGMAWNQFEITLPALTITRGIRFAPESSSSIVNAASSCAVPELRSCTSIVAIRLFMSTFSRMLFKSAMCMDAV